MQGHFGEAVQILEKGVAADLASKGAYLAAAKLMAIAHAQLSLWPRSRRGQPPPSVRYSAVERRRAILWPAARSSRLGTSGRARPIAETLAKELQAEPQAYAKILEGLMALKADDGRKAVAVILEANKLFDTWIGHLELGRADLGS